MRKVLTTTIDKDLLEKAKKYAKENFANSGNGQVGINSVIEEALALYFSNLENSVWEKSLSSGWVKRLVIQRKVVFYENVKCRKKLKEFNISDYSDEALLSRGWKKI